ncbi:hypothetical protein FGK63_09280 [Ruegeria sediminis]|uniref:Methionyl-tRNA formyltransferase n=1 Tax=Ruegeria sediminis TaxID=2583820 RepID=A0ABY2WYF4_9RHOB|nr:hypothetical protein [Ruegeria sediminis]TMV07651.1 hypothetical protein FGK63_09280 [Ruegeria sediminis]
MALVTQFERDEREFRSLHPTQVVCKYLVSESGGKKVLQLNTYGSAERDMPDKLSQTLQFDENSARQLLAILNKEFGNA